MSSLSSSLEVVVAWGVQGWENGSVHSLACHNIVLIGSSANPLDNTVHRPSATLTVCWHIGCTDRSCSDAGRNHLRPLPDIDLKNWAFSTVFIRRWYVICDDALTLMWWQDNNRGDDKVSTTCPLWRHQVETFSALLALCAGNSLVTGEFPSQRPVTRSFDVFFELCLNKRLTKQSWGWWFETPSRSLWRQCNLWPQLHEVEVTRTAARP